MAKYKIRQVIEDCIGCGACESVDPDNWKLEDDGKAHLVDGKKTEEGYEKEVDELGELGEAEDVCPVDCIHIEELGGSEETPKPED